MFRTLPLTALLLGALLGCGTSEPTRAKDSTPAAVAGDADPKASADDADPKLRSACTHVVELTEGSSTEDQITRCMKSDQRMREDTEADDATFERYLQCELDAKTPNDLTDCVMIMAEGPAKKAKAGMEKMMAEAAGDAEAALARIRSDAAAGVITAETLARVEEGRSKAGVGRFSTVLDDAHALIEAGRVAPGTTVEIVIHPGLGGEPLKLPPGEMAADLAFTDAKTGRRVARVSPTGGEILSIGAFSDRLGTLMRWWAQDPEGHDVELAIVPDPESPGFAAPPGVTGARALLELGGLLERPVLVFPDGSSKTLGQWLGG